MSMSHHQPKSFKFDDEEGTLNIYEDEDATDLLIQMSISSFNQMVEHRFDIKVKEPAQ